MIVEYNPIENQYSKKHNHSLTLGRKYIPLSLAINCSSYRDLFSNCVSIQRDSDKEPVLFDLNLFNIIDNCIPEGWIVETDGENGYCLSPQEFLGDFWDRFEDGDAEAEKVFEQVVRKLHKFHGWEFEPEVFDDFIEQLLLNENQYLRPRYDEYVIKYLPDMADYVDVNTKIHALGSALADGIVINSLLPQTLIDSLKAMETYAVQLEDVDMKQSVSRNFFKPILEQLLVISEDHNNYRYRRLFKDHLGPACEECCEQINPKWHSLI